MIVTTLGGMGSSAEASGRLLMRTSLLITTNLVIAISTSDEKTEAPNDS
jgi:hypothetical protein